MAVMGLSEYAAKKTLEHAMGKASWTMPTNVYVALYNGDPLGAGSELADPPDTDYAREMTEAADWASAGFVSPRASIANAAEIDFGTSGAAWGTVDYVAIFDAATDGNMIASGALTSSVNITSGIPVKFPIGALVVYIDQITIV